MTEFDDLIRKIQGADLTNEQKCIFELIDQVHGCADTKRCDFCQVSLVSLRERLLEEFTGAKPCAKN